MRRELAVFTVNRLIDKSKFYQNEPCFPLLESTLTSPITTEHLKKVGSVSEGTDFGQKKKLKPWVYWFMV